MNKKILILILVIGLILLSGLVLWSMEKKQKPEITKQELLQKFQTLRTQYEQARLQGNDISEIEKLEKEAKQAYDNGDYKTANELLNSATNLLNNISVAPSVEIKNPCDSAPWWYKTQCNDRNAWLDRKLVEWKPAKYNPMKFNGHLLFSSEQMIDMTNSDADSAFFEVIKDSNTDTISLFIFPDMFEKHKQRYETLINKIRSSNKQLYVAYMVGNHADSDIFKTYSSFKEYKDTELAFTRMFVEKYHPDYYVVVDEITTMEKRAEMNASDIEWKELVIEIADLVKNISPQTKIIATGHLYELAFLRSLVDVNNLDLIGINSFGTLGYDENTKEGKEVSYTIEYVKQKNKEIILEQTWSELLDAPEAKWLYTQEFMKKLDPKFIKVLAYYANLHNVSIYSPFYINKFVSYSNDPQIFAKALLYDKERTPVFYAYTDVILEFKR